MIGIDLPDEDSGDDGRLGRCRRALFLPVVTF
jgi:hypothetical protein